MKLFNSSTFNGVITNEVWSVLVDEGRRLKVENSQNEASSVANLLGMSLANAYVWKRHRFSGYRVDTECFFEKVLNVLKSRDPNSECFGDGGIYEEYKSELTERIDNYRRWMEEEEEKLRSMMGKKLKIDRDRFAAETRKKAEALGLTVEIK